MKVTQELSHTPEEKSITDLPSPTQPLLPPSCPEPELSNDPSSNPSDHPITYEDLDNLRQDLFTFIDNWKSSIISELQKRKLSSK